MYPSQCRYCDRVVNKCFSLFGKQNMNLGAKFHNNRIHNGVWELAMSPVIYAEKAVKTWAVHLPANYGGRFMILKKAENSFEMGYDPKFDNSLE